MSIVNYSFYISIRECWRVLKSTIWTRINLCLIIHTIILIETESQPKHSHYSSDYSHKLAAISKQLIQFFTSSKFFKKASLNNK